MSLSRLADNKPLHKSIHVLCELSCPDSWMYNSKDFEGPKWMTLHTLLQLTPMPNATVQINTRIFPSSVAMAWEMCSFTDAGYQHDTSQLFGFELKCLHGTFVFQGRPQIHKI